MPRHEITAPVAGGVLSGWVHGDGPPVLLLHGGPGLSFEYLDGLDAELGDGYRIAAYQQRGVGPSTTDGPFDLATAADDAASVLDHLGWGRAWVVGHSWGGHLAVQLADRIPQRLLGAVVVDPLGAWGDGGAEAFEAQMNARTPEESRERAKELDDAAMAGNGTREEALEALELVWPAYFADPEQILSFAVTDLSVEAYAGTWSEVETDLPRLGDALSGITVPMVFVHGELSPMPVSASADTVDRLPDATLEVVERAGHFVWFERPGSVRSALDRLVQRVGAPAG
jgi:pimeloyl-ACP methyl ester carboxylesterase